VASTGDGAHLGFGSEVPGLTDGQSLFAEEFGEVVNLSDGGQIEMKKLLGAYLKRIERERSGMPRRLFPFAAAGADAKDDSPKPVVIDPRIQFGTPCIVGTGIPTAIIAERFEAGDSIEQLAEDYERSPQEIEAAIRYEQASAA
jgi:uncharacterized protein (DUF433 family)